MEGTDEYTELWRHPQSVYCFWYSLKLKNIIVVLIIVKYVVDLSNSNFPIAIYNTKVVRDYKFIDCRYIGH